jgi:S1-C subfamily serine protease
VSKTFKFLMLLSVLSCIGLFCYAIINLNQRTIAIEVWTNHPPEVSKLDLRNLREEYKRRHEERIETLRAELRALHGAMQNQADYNDFVKERLTALETRIADYEVTKGDLNELQQMLVRFAEDLKSQEAMILPEKFAEDLSPLVNVHIFTSMVMPATANRGEMRIDTKDGISGWVSKINGEPVVFAAAHIPKKNLSGDIVCYFGDGRLATAVTLFAWSNGFDCAVFKFKPGYKYEGGYLDLGDSDELKRLSPVVVMGSPDALSQNTHFMTSYGYVMDPKFKSKYSGPQPCVILHWAICNSGNSGGPLLDRYGRVIGMNVMVMDGSTWIVKEENRLKDMKFRSLVYAATPINDIKRLLPKLMRGGEVKHGWVSGLEIKQSSLIEPSNFKDLGLAQPTENVPVVVKVSQASGAYKAGIKRGDVLVSVNGAKVHDEADFQREIMHLDPGDEAKIMLRREGKEIEVLAKTTSFFWSPPGPPPMVIEPSKKK